MSSSIPHKKREEMCTAMSIHHIQKSRYIFLMTMMLLSLPIEFPLAFLEMWIFMCIYAFSIEESTKINQHPEHVSNNISKLQIKKESDTEMEQKPTIIIIQCRKMCFVAVEKR